MVFHFAFLRAGNESSCCSLPLSAFGVVSVLGFGHSNRCVVVSHCYFNLQFSNGDFSHEIRRWLLLGRKAMTNRQCIKKQRHHLPTKVCIVKVLVFPVVMYGYESWTIKKAEHWRIDAFEVRGWRRLLRVPWAVRRSNQSILKEISPEYSLEGLDAEAPVLWPPDVKSWLTRRDPDAGTWAWANSERWWGTGRPGVLQSTGSQRVRHDWAIELNCQSHTGQGICLSSPPVYHDLMKVKVSVAQSCPTLYNFMDCSPPGSSVHGILQARTLAWVATPFSRGFSWPSDRTWVSLIAGRFFTVCATRDTMIL